MNKYSTYGASNGQTYPFNLTLSSTTNLSLTHECYQKSDESIMLVYI